jgi:hypothetical protein
LPEPPEAAALGELADRAHGGDARTYTELDEAAAAFRRRLMKDAALPAAMLDAVRLIAPGFPPATRDELERAQYVLGLTLMAGVRGELDRIDPIERITPSDRKTAKNYLRAGRETFGDAWERAERAWIEREHDAHDAEADLYGGAGGRGPREHPGSAAIFELDAALLEVAPQTSKTDRARVVSRLVTAAGIEEVSPATVLSRLRERSRRPSPSPAP